MANLPAPALTIGLRTSALPNNNQVKFYCQLFFYFFKHSFLFCFFQKHSAAVDALLRLPDILRSDSDKAAGNVREMEEVANGDDDATAEGSNKKTNPPMELIASTPVRRYKQYTEGQLHKVITVSYLFY